MHTLVALALTAPVLIFYVVIAGDALGYRQLAEPHMVVSVSSLNQICSALAKDKRP